MSKITTTVFQKITDPDKLLERCEEIMTSPESTRLEKSKAELTYVQIGIISPLAQDFLEASGLN